MTGDQRVEVVALEWSEASEPDSYCSYNHSFADSPFGRYQIEWKGWKAYPSFSLEGPCDNGFIPTVGCTLEDVRAEAQEHFAKAILSALRLPG